MPKASTFGLITASQVIDSDTIPIITNAGDNKRLPISESRNAIGPGWSDTVNAFNEIGVTDEIKIQAGISRAVSTGKTIVFVPTSMLPYNASLITFNNAIRMTREGGDFSVYDVQAYGAAGDNTQDDTLSIQAAINAVAALSNGGVVKLPEGLYKTTAVLNISFGVQVFGDGQTISVLKPVATNCFGLDAGLYGTGFGNLLFQNFGIDGTSCTTHTAINNAGTLVETDQFYGLTLNKIAITNYNKAVNLRSIRTVLVTGSWFQWITAGIDMRGYNLVIRISETQIICTGGTGAGTKRGILLDRFNFTGGAGQLGPEGVQITNSQIFGFDYGITVNACNYCNIIEADIDSNIYGIEFSTAQNGFVIRDCYVAVSASTGLSAIIGHGVASPYQSKCRIKDNTLIGSSTTTCSGITINDAGNSNQDNVDIDGNLLTGFTTSDILINNGNDVRIRNNRCRSTGITTNITLATPIGPGPIVIDSNECAVGITNPGSYGASGLVDVGVNTVAGVRVGGRGTWTAVPFTAGDFFGSGSMVWTVGSGDVLSFTYAIHNRMMTVQFFLVSTSVSGTPSDTLNILIPGGKTSSRRTLVPVIIGDNGVNAMGYVQVQAANTIMGISRLDAGNFSAATNTTNVFGEITFEID